MDNWLIFSKLITLTFFVVKYTGRDTGRTTEVVLLALLYICANMVIHIAKMKKLKACFLLISLLLIGSSFQFVNPLFIFLLPISIFEIVWLFREALWLPLIITALPLVLLDKGMRAEYFLAGAFGCVMYLQAYKYNGRLQILSREKDEMREKIHLLSGKLTKDLDYERQMKYSSQLEERNKIAQEIHDRLGHAMAGSLMQLEAASLLLDKDMNKSRQIIENVIGVLREGMENIRSTLRSIKPAAEQLGINRIKLILDEFSLKNGLKTMFSHTGNLDRISHLQWKVIGDNLNEGLTNTLKYAQASLVMVQIDVLNKFIKAEIRDNGIGAYSIKKGLGILGMEERSESIGGKVIVDGSKGFSIITLLPLEGQKQ